MATVLSFERCDTASITLLTPRLDFADIPQGPMGMVREQALAISFEVISPSSTVTLEYVPGGAPAPAQLVAQTVTVREPVSGQTWSVLRKLEQIYSSCFAQRQPPHA